MAYWRRKSKRKEKKGQHLSNRGDQWWWELLIEITNEWKRKKKIRFFKYRGVRICNNIKKYCRK